MPIADRITRYSVSVLRSNVQSATRQLRLTLESGGSATISFREALPTDFLQFVGSATNLSMTADQFADAYHLVQTESPVFFTALDLFGIKIGSVHTELDLSAGETPGEGDRDPQSLEALVRRGRELGTDRASG